MICFDQLKEEKITPSGPVKLEIYPVNEVNSNAQDKCIFPTYVSDYISI